MENIMDKMVQKKRERKYFPESFMPSTWEAVEPEFEKLLAEPIGSAEELIAFWKKASELDFILEDHVAWLYIRMTQFADQEEHKNAFNGFMADVGAKSQPYAHKLKQKFYGSPFRKELPEEYALLSRIIANDIELFREENVSLSVKEQELSARYGEITSKMTVMFDGEERTMQQLAPYLEKADRAVREQAWRAMYGRYAQDKEELDKLFDELKEIRVQMAKNAGFANYRDYMHQAKGRFSYSPDDLLSLHEAVEKAIVPLVEEFGAERRKKLNLETLRPWDFSVETEGELPKPFVTHEDMIAKSIETVRGVDPAFGAELKKMHESGFIDAENRKGKAPGGYCYPLNEYGSSFIFMHAVGVKRDVETIVHEAGHAMHNMMGGKKQDIIQYRQNPSEVAELASMSMELLSLDKWSFFYPSDCLESVKRSELMEKIKLLPWGVVVDAFQHWLYLNPEHTVEEREAYFSELLDRFKIGGDWTGLEKEKAMRWMLQIHIFEYPFYYIEYVMAQLGALALYCNYRKDSEKAIKEYKDFLSLSYSRPVDELYAAAGIKFDFSVEYIQELADFVKGELARLKN